MSALISGFVQESAQAELYSKVSWRDRRGARADDGRKHAKCALPAGFKIAENLLYHAYLTSCCVVLFWDWKRLRQHPLHGMFCCNGKNFRREKQA